MPLRNPISNTFDALGLLSVLLSGYMHVMEWLETVNFNKLVLGGTSLFGLIYLIFKAENMFLQNKRLRRDLKVEKKKKYKIISRKGG